ncbi:MAG TPA: efflux RND transporter permease subunit [Thermoanaerobaculia bacterium]|nr:efflux RND transporter permease subunit [Thermoanaerobaculia bacterium]
MQWLAEICVKRPVFAAVLMLTIVVVGLAGYSQLGLEQFPNIDAPTITITTNLEGAAPEEVESDITERIEQAVSTIAGLDTLSSTSSEGRSVVTAEFALEKNGDVAAQEVRDQVNRILSDLPEGTESPEIQKMDPAASPILYIAVRTSAPLVTATEFADKKIRRQLEGISGVGQVSVVGGRKRQINVWLDPEALRAYGLTAKDVQNAISSQNSSVPGGVVSSGPVDHTLRVQGRVGSVEELASIVVKQFGARSLHVSDLARVDDSGEEETTIATVNGERTLLLTVRKQAGENTVAVVDAVRRRLREIEKNLPSGYKLEVIRDDSGVVRTSVSTVKEHLVLGAIFASLVVLLFLGNLRSAIVSALAIPVSIIGTFALMWWQGFTLNMITLLALALAIGIVIDDAIVVLENIFRFVQEKGMKPFPAAIAATKDIGLAVLATTFSLMAVFLPVAFMSGMAGRFMRGFGVTMAFAIAISLIVAFTLTPSLTARIIDPPQLDDEGKRIATKRSRLERLVDRLYRPVERVYMVMLRWSMAHRWVIVVASVVALLSTVPLLMVVRTSFMPDNDEGQFQVTVRAPEGTSRASTSLIAERIATGVRQLPGVVLTSTTIGNDSQGSANEATIYVLLTDPETRKETAAELVAKARREVLAKQPKDVRITLSESTGPGNGIEYDISGPDLAQLGAYSRQIVNELRKTPAAADVNTSYIEGKPELVAHLDRAKAADLGVAVTDVAETLRLFVGGRKVSTYAERGEEYEVHVRADQRYRGDAEGLSLLTVPSSIHGSVPLRDVVELVESSGPANINRERRQRQVTISANVTLGYGQNDVQAAIKKIGAGLHMRDGYQFEAAGVTKEGGRTASAFIGALLLSIVFMYLVLAAQFESWLHPFTIMLALPLTVPFALLSVIVFNGSLNIFSGLGLFVLFGIVKKNSILQVDHTNHLRDEGLSRLDAVLQANRDRLRPILMTTIAFVAGMLPLVIARGIGAGQSKAIASIVIGGQTFSLLLTLLAVPVAYTLFDDLATWTKRRFFAGTKADRGEAELEGVAS